MQELIQELDKILPVVVRVHGENHSELAQVGELYTKLREAMDQDNKEEAKKYMQQLREVSKGFAIPSDACPTYTKTYEDLVALEQQL